MEKNVSSSNIFIAVAIAAGLTAACLEASATPVVFDQNPPPTVGTPTSPGGDGDDPDTIAIGLGAHAGGVRVRAPQ